MKALQRAIGLADGFDGWPHAEKLRFFAWALHADGHSEFRLPTLSACFDQVHVQPPKNLYRAVEALHEQGDLLRSNGGYRLTKGVRDRLEEKYGDRPMTVRVHELLASLPGQLSSVRQQEYLDEALRCFRAEAWRASIIMAWNLAFDHVCEIVLSRLVDFNAAVPKAFPKSKVTAATHSDLREMNEGFIIRVCRTADIVDKTQGKCLDRSLGIRNDAAHPSGATFSQLKAEAFILDVVQEIVLGLRPGT